MSEYVTAGLAPAGFFKYFEEISRIPRGSGNEKAVSEYLIEFAKAHNLEYYTDDIYNVFIRKPASKGCEDKPAVMLQGHTDMVCEKNNDVVHDFLTDPIKLVIEGDYLRADGTTLGADDGESVALMLDLLSDETLVHPAIECLFTVQEETGLAGAKQFDCSKVTADIMINIDAGPEGQALLSCAGGMRCRMKKTAPKSDAVNSENGYKLFVTGLMGGHSGADIHLNRGNANKLMCRILSSLDSDKLRIADINGGSKDNAIPRECCAYVLYSGDDIEQKVKQLEKQIAAELTKDDANFNVTVEKAEVKQAFDYKTSQQIINAAVLSPNGVMAMSADIEGLVETSCNLGVITTDQDTVKLIFAPRSSRESMQDYTQNVFERIAAAFDFEIQTDSRYPGWAYQPDSKIKELFCKKYNELFGEELQINAIHAGLECGLIKDKLPDLDIIAVGTTVYNMHTPQEKLYIPSCGRLRDLVCGVITAVAQGEY